MTQQLPIHTDYTVLLIGQMAEISYFPLFYFIMEPTRTPAFHCPIIVEMWTLSFQAFAPEHRFV
jgi:hypothetical protein